MITKQLKTTGSDQTQEGALNSFFKNSKMKSAVSFGFSIGTKWPVFSKNRKAADGTLALNLLAAEAKKVSESAP